MKNNFKLVMMILSLCIIVIASISICSYAKTGTYATLNGTCEYNASNRSYTGHASAMNTSGTTRYINISLKTTNSAVITANGRAVTHNDSIGTSYVNITAYSYVYGSCTVYKAGSPSSGVAETLTVTIR